MINRNKKIVQRAEKGPASYISAIVLGLNDALVELTGALAGFTMVFTNNKMIILAGFTTGIAATLSMAASEFLSREADTECGNPYFSAFITGCAYLITVIILLLPYFIFDKPMVSLVFCLFFGGLIIMGFTYFESRVRKASFVPLWLQMLCISFGVAAISFLISAAAKHLWGLSI